MGDRFYRQQLDTLGTCPGYKSTKKRKRNMSWDAEKKLKAIEMYLAGNPTPENSMELVKEIAEELEESPNGVKMILVKSGEYVKVSPSTPSSSTSTPKEGARPNKEASHTALKELIKKVGGSVDEEIVSKLTGKAAVYLTDVFSKVAK